ncbi:hypothetical protein [Nocardia carnea]|uniref:hypothetical protein n=1 Tax=Nocardia carnea TaxID=37328 RepID=UPI002457BBDE|nr:hypothetical protein [Nocardia carnea]
MNETMVAPRGANPASVGRDAGSGGPDRGEFIDAFHAELAEFQPNGWPVAAVALFERLSVLCVRDAWCAFSF